AAKGIPQRIRQMLQGEILKAEVNHIRKDGTVFPVEISAGLLKLGNRNYIFAFDRDITARKKAAAALEESSERIQNFAYTISHDLKNPAVALTGLTKLLKRRYDHALDAQGRDICHKIIDSSNEITRLVDSINAFITTKEAPLNVELVDPRELLAAVQEEYEEKIRRRRIDWHQSEVMNWVRADRLSLLRVFRNLVDNALKYGGDDLSRIEIAYGQSREFHFFSVSNDGVGIEPGEAKKIFSLFKRQATSSGIEGAGLGLAIVKEVAERHRGYVWAESDGRRGIAFHVAISKTL
ncbi:MAG: ATP-binding protein, partial [bacterium]|nr:ATP-binding protein [bacterium]